MPTTYVDLSGHEEFRAEFTNVEEWELWASLLKQIDELFDECFSQWESGRQDAGWWWWWNNVCAFHQTWGYEMMPIELIEIAGEVEQLLDLPEERCLFQPEE